MRTPWKPAASKASRKPVSVSAPEMQPLHSSGSCCSSWGTASSLTMSEMTARPPLRSTR